MDEKNIPPPILAQELDFTREQVMRLAEISLQRTDPVAKEEALRALAAFDKRSEARAAAEAAPKPPPIPSFGGDLDDKKASPMPPSGGGLGDGKAPPTSPPNPPPNPPPSSSPMPAFGGDLGEEKASPEPTPKPALAPSALLYGDISKFAFKSDMSTMEHPFFALKAGDMRVRKYVREANCLTEVHPGEGGCATIYDKDVWIYCVSLMVEAMNRRREIGKTVSFTAVNFLKATRRGTSGRAYQRMADALNRLNNTDIETIIETGGHLEYKRFGLIESWRIIEIAGTRMGSVEVTFPDWLTRSVTAKNILTLSPDYFKIRKAIDRRLYEIVRKHIGKKRIWRCSVKKLHEKSGSMDTLRKLRAVLKVLAKNDSLLGYSMSLDLASDVVTFIERNGG